MAIRKAMEWLENQNPGYLFRKGTVNIEPPITQGDVEIDGYLSGFLSSRFRFKVPYVKWTEETYEEIEKIAYEFELRVWRFSYGNARLRTGIFFGEVAALYSGYEFEKNKHGSGFISSKYERAEELFTAVMKRVYKARLD